MPVVKLHARNWRTLPARAEKRTEYRDAKAIRMRAAQTRMIAIEGV